jgi:hypothetical protein
VEAALAWIPTTLEEALRLAFISDFKKESYSQPIKHQRFVVLKPSEKVRFYPNNASAFHVFKCRPCFFLSLLFKTKPLLHEKVFSFDACCGSGIGDLSVV